MIKAKVLAIATLAAAVLGSASARAAAPFQFDSLGPISDVTAHWQRYQPARAFCIRPNAPQYTPGGTGATDTGSDRACRRSGFPASATGLVRVAIRAPVLCAGCRRLFIDFSKIGSGSRYAHGHVFYRLASANFSYTFDPLAHSPNTKNFTNDKLLVPEGSAQEPIVWALDLHQFAGFTSDTARFVHNAIQGPYYTGPWYVNRHGRRIWGVYLDVDVADATRYSSAQLNELGYVAGFNSGSLCQSDGDLLYAGCADAWSFSASAVDPFS
jgi:hypothetical protein